MFSKSVREVVPKNSYIYYSRQLVKPKPLRPIIGREEKYSVYDFICFEAKIEMIVVEVCTVEGGLKMSDNYSPLLTLSRGASEGLNLPIYQFIVNTLIA